MSSRSFDKLMEEIGGMTVLELSDFVKGLENKFGVSAAAPAASVASSAVAAPAAAVVEEKTKFKVTLQDSGAEKMKVTRAVKQIVPTMNLMEAKKAVDETPSTIADGVSKDEAHKMKEALEAAGAKVVLS